MSDSPSTSNQTVKWRGIDAADLVVRLAEEGEAAFDVLLTDAAQVLLWEHTIAARSNDAGVAEPELTDWPVEVKLALISAAVKIAGIAALAGCLAVVVRAGYGGEIVLNATGVSLSFVFNKLTLAD